MNSSQPKTFVDLSVAIEETASEVIPVRIRYFSHREGAEQMGAIFGLKPDDLPEKTGWAGEEVNLITHAGTHMDAPWHYGPVSENERARTIDEVPLDWCFGPGVVLNFQHKEDGSEVTVNDLKTALQGIGHQLQPGDIVLLQTGASRWWGSNAYPEHGMGLGRESTLWLVRQGIRVIGTDGWGMDKPFSYMRREFQETADINSIWPSHYAGREKEYCQLEKLTNLELLPPHGFTVACFPIKITKASAGWSRVVAIL